LRRDDRCAAGDFYDVLVAQSALELTEKLVRIGEEGIKSSEH